MVDLLIRVDASPEMGMGHFMRCLALAEHCHTLKMSVHFVCYTLVESCQRKLAGNSFPIHYLKNISPSEQAKETLAIADAHQAKAILFDGYHFSEDYLNHFKNTSLQLWMIDDFGGVPDYFHMALNFQPWADPASYSQHCKSFIGLDYYLLRKEFWSFPQDSKYKTQQILLTMGGTDPHQQTMRVLNILRELNNQISICVILGSMVPDILEYVEMSKNNNQQITIHTNPENMPELMAASLFAITAGGGTCWELAFMGTPSIVMAQADNQTQVAEYVIKHRVGINLGAYNKVTDQNIIENVMHLLTNEDQRAGMQMACASLNVGKRVSEVTEFMKRQCSI
jgi:UDP-2,4-diacetamido-2,4,6-trideoxy-beta-L-altropyranose hydrolase